MVLPEGTFTTANKVSRFPQVVGQSSPASMQTILLRGLLAHLQHCSSSSHSLAQQALGRGDPLAHSRHSTHWGPPPPAPCLGVQQAVVPSMGPVGLPIIIIIIIIVIPVPVSSPSLHCSPSMNSSPNSSVHVSSIVGS